ncbi:MAG: hypothetical protein ABIR66_02230 [Saprospiraceae bacterium]
MDRNTTNNEVKNFSEYWREQLNMFGINVNYYGKQYDLTDDDPLYGEDLERGFDIPQEIVVGANITNDSSMLSKFGIVTDSDMTIYIHIDDFREIFGEDAEPKSGDVIELLEVGADRIGGRGSPKYVVTERSEDDIPIGMNPLMSHFLWFIKLKRFEFSHEPGITPEEGSGIVDDQGPLPDDILDDSDPGSRIPRPGIPAEVSKLPGASSNYKEHEDELYGRY